MANVTEKNKNFNSEFGLTIEKVSKKVIGSRFIKNVRGYFIKPQTSTNEDHNPINYRHHLEITPAEAWTRDSVRMNIR